MATLGVISLISIVLVVGLIALVIFVLRKIYGEKEEPRNEDIIINGLSDYTDGYGLVLKKETKSNKEIISIKGSPRDIDYLKIKDKDFKIKEQKIFVRKDLLIPLGFSAHRKMYLALPDKPEHLPNELKETKFGKYVMEFLNEQNKEQNHRRIEETQEKNSLILRKLDEGLENATNIIKQDSDFMRERLKSSVAEPIKKNE